MMIITYSQLDQYKIVIGNAIRRYYGSLIPSKHEIISLSSHIRQSVEMSSNIAQSWSLSSNITQSISLSSIVELE